MKILITVAVLLAIANASPAVIQVEPEPKLLDTDYRVDEEYNILAISYDIEIHPFFDVVPAGKTPFTFDAVTTFKFQALQEFEPLNSFKFNSYKLIYDDTKTILTRNGTVVEGQIIREIHLEEATQIMTITFEEELIFQEIYELTFEYSGEITDEMVGFYQSYYYEGATKVYLGTTHLQRTNARRVFPSLDEPFYKALFSIKVSAPKGYSVISNTELELKESVEIEGEAEERELFVFKSTPKMSTYLVAFVVSKFVATTDPASDGRLKVWTRPDQQSQAVYAAEFAPRMLKALGDYFDYDYYSVEGIDKMDLAAIPDFAAGAMENWGLLTYREVNTLYDAEETSLISQQRIAAVIAHEQTHMWFGNLVTCRWWAYTWLNEGFARYFQYFGMALIETDWELEKQFPVDQVQSAMLLDSTTSTHPMSDVTVNTPAQAQRMFDNISYNKGAAFLRMISHMVEVENFRTALQNYLIFMSLTQADPVWILRFFEAWSFVPTLIFDMRPWTEQPGYPLVTVTVSADRKIATVSQKRFWQDPEDDDGSNLSWVIPLTFATTTQGFDDDTTKLLMREITEDIEINAVSWVVFNVHQIGFYRVNYDDASWNLIKGVLIRTVNGHLPEEMPEVNRAQIVDDLFQLARAGHVTYGRAFDITSYLANERSYFPWLSAFNSFTFLTSRMDDASLNKFKTYLKDIVSHAYEMVGFDRNENESRTTTYLRSLIYNWACKIGHGNCIQTTREHFNKFKATPSVPVEVNIRPTVYCSAMREGDLSDFEKLWDKYLNVDVPTEQITILTAIGCARDKDVIAEVIEKILSDAVRPQDRRSALTATYTSTEENLSSVYEYAKINYPRIEAGFGSSKLDVITTFSSIASRFTTQEQIDDLKTFVEKDTAYFGTSLDDAIAGAEKNLKWINANIPQINTFIDEYFKDSSAATNVVSVLLLSATGIFTYFMF